jgi:hypothetical protein
MRTSTGWALANTWYDTAPAPAPRGSLLESVFTHVFVERKKTELMSTRALVQAVLPEGKKGDPVVDAYQKFVEFLMPFLEKTETSDLDKQKKTLAEFVKYNAKINLTDYFKQQVATAKRLSLLKSLKKKKT